MTTPDPKILTAPAGDAVVESPASDSGSPAAGPADQSVATIGALRAEMVRDRFDAVAARAGVDAAYVEVALKLFESTGKEPTKANMATFVESMKKDKPALFGPQPASTAPTPSIATPAAPAPGGISNYFEQWRSLLAAGRKTEAEAF